MRHRSAQCARQSGRCPGRVTGAMTPLASANDDLDRRGAAYVNVRPHRSAPTDFRRRDLQSALGEMPRTGGTSARTCVARSATPLVFRGGTSVACAVATMSLRRTTFMLAAAVCAALASRSPALAAPTAADSGSPSVAALTICELAEQAVDRDGSDAKAHFAVFCNLGKKTQSAGPSVRQVFVIDLLKREIDS